MMNDDMWDAFAKIGEAMNERENNLDKLADTCEYDMKLAVTRWVLKHVADHGKDGGSYRYLIYDRLGFGPDAYAPLCNDGLFISNEFDSQIVSEARKALAAGDHENLKKILSCCDEPGCYEQISAGFPAEGGYRSTCCEHYRMYSLKYQERKDGSV